jgi:hypothetical protein
MKPTDFIVEHNPFIAQDADEMHRDNEVQMARSDLYASADYAIKLHKILRGINDSADMEQWVMEKIAIANENLRTVYEYLNYEAREQEGALPSFQFESAEKQFEEILEEDWKSALAGGALAATMALGGGYAHADEAPRDVPAATQQADGGSLASRFTPGIDFSSAPYTINAGGKEYKFAGRDAQAPKGQAVTVPATLIGIRGLKPIKVILAADGKYYSAPMGEGVAEGADERKQNALWAQINQHEQAAKKSKDLKQQHHLKMADQLRSQLKTSDNEVAEGVAEGSDQQWVVTVGTKTGGTSHTMTFSGTKEQAIKKAVARFGTSKNPVITAKPKQQGVAESCDAGATGASSMATGAVGAAAPMQRRVKQESAATKKYGNAMKTKAPKIGKGVY